MRHPRPSGDRLPTLCTKSRDSKALRDYNSGLLLSFKGFVTENCYGNKIPGTERQFLVGTTFHGY